MNLSFDSVSQRNLARRVRSLDEVFSFEEHPALASLCACVGLRFEMGNPLYDRLSPFLGREPGDAWKSELVIRDGELGIRLEPADGRPLQPRHPDLRYILDAASLDSQGRLTSAVIFPRTVSATFAKKGFRLVIVRDWILASALNSDPQKAVSYLEANTWEIQSSPVRIQGPMMLRRDLAFFGTHDIVDHLFGLDRTGFEKLRATQAQVVEKVSEVFRRTTHPHGATLIVAYLLGIVLDDLAQPRWYGSEAHEAVLEHCQSLLGRDSARETHLPPSSFHEVVRSMRSGEGLAALKTALNAFATELVSEPGQFHDHAVASGRVVVGQLHT